MYIFDFKLAGCQSQTILLEAHYAHNIQNKINICFI